MRLLDRNPVEFGNDVAPAQTDFLRRAALGNFCNQGAASFADLKHAANFRSHRLDRDAEPSTGNFSSRLQLRDDGFGLIHRNGKADADIAARAAKNRRVDADHFASQE
jgi:hypothetical protein